MRAVLIRVIPWAVFGVGTGIWGALTGTALAAVSCAIVVITVTRRAKNSWRSAILDLGGFVYFAGFAALLVAVSSDAVEDYAAAGSQLFLAAVVGGFLVAGLPFTEPIALADMETDEQQRMAGNPHFHRFCIRLTMIWLGAFVVSGTLLVALTASGQNATWLTVVIIVAGLTLPFSIQKRMIAAVTELPGTTDERR